MNRGDRANQHGEIRLFGKEADEWEGLQKRKADILYRLGRAILRLRQLGQLPRA